MNFIITEDQVKYLYNFLMNLPARDSYPMLRMLEMLPPYDKKLNIEEQPNENLPADANADNVLA